MSTIGTVEVTHESGVAIYDAKTGDIVHRHEVLTVRGGTHPDEKTMEREALALFAQSHPDHRAETAVLHFDPRALAAGQFHKVDVAARRLVEVPVAAGPLRR
jgi:hypothetical protein